MQAKTILPGYFQTFSIDFMQSAAMNTS